MLPEVAAQNPIAVELEKAIPGSVVDLKNDLGGPALYVTGASIVAAAKHLCGVEGFVRLSAVTAVDWWPRDPRFEVVYLLHSIAKNSRLRLIVRAKESDSLNRFRAFGAAPTGMSGKFSICLASSFSTTRIWNGL